MIGIPKRRRRSPPRKKKVGFTPREIRILQQFDVPRIICVHLIGENHTVRHRMGVGVIIMTCGVILSKITAHMYILGFFGEMFGYLIHGIGSIPFVEAVNSHLVTKMNSSSTSFVQSDEPVEEEAQS